MKLGKEKYDKVQKKLSEISKILSEIREITNDDPRIGVLLNKGYGTLTEIRKELKEL